MKFLYQFINFFITTRGSKLGIYVHWQMVTPKMKINTVQAMNCPVKLKGMVNPEVYHIDDIDSQMLFDTVK